MVPALHFWNTNSAIIDKHYNSIEHFNIPLHSYAQNFKCFIPYSLRHECSTDLQNSTQLKKLQSKPSTIWWLNKQDYTHYCPLSQPIYSISGCTIQICSLPQALTPIFELSANLDTQLSPYFKSLILLVWAKNWFLQHSISYIILACKKNPQFIATFSLLCNNQSSIQVKSKYKSILSRKKLGQDFPFSIEGSFFKGGATCENENWTPVVL